MLNLRHFKPAEFRCRHCSELPQESLMLLVDKIREDFGHPILITSGKRCTQHNKSIGGAKSSRHVVGDACDMQYTEALLTFLLSRLETYQICMEDPQVTVKDGFGWIHIDCLKRGSYRVFQP